MPIAGNASTSDSRRRSLVRLKRGPAFLDEVCAGDDGLRQQLDRLVRATSARRGFLEAAVVADAFRSSGVG
jgi:hypothetical protein